MNDKLTIDNVRRAFDNMPTCHHPVDFDEWMNRWLQADIITLMNENAETFKLYQQTIKDMGIIENVKGT